MQKIKKGQVSKHFSFSSNFFPPQIVDNSTLCVRVKEMASSSTRFFLSFCMNDLLLSTNGLTTKTWNCIETYREESQVDSSMHREGVGLDVVHKCTLTDCTTLDI